MAFSRGSQTPQHLEAPARSLGDPRLRTSIGPRGSKSKVDFTGPGEPRLQPSQTCKLKVRTGSQYASEAETDC